MLVLPPVVLAHTPCGVLVAFQLLQPLFLLLFTNLEKELQHQITVVRQLSFETLYALNTLRILLIRQFAPKSSLRHLIHPAGIQEFKLPGFRNFYKVPIQERLPLLFLCRCGHGSHLEESGIDIFNNSADSAALTGRTPAFDQHQHRELMLLDLHLESTKLLLRRIQSFFQFLFFRLHRRNPLFQHTVTTLSRNPRLLTYISLVYTIFKKYKSNWEIYLQILFFHPFSDIIVDFPGLHIIRTV